MLLLSGRDRNPLMKFEKNPDVVFTQKIRDGIQVTNVHKQWESVQYYYREIVHMNLRENFIKVVMISKIYDISSTSRSCCVSLRILSMMRRCYFGKCILDLTDNNFNEEQKAQRSFHIKRHRRTSLKVSSSRQCVLFVEYALSQK